MSDPLSPHDPTQQYRPRPPEQEPPPGVPPAPQAAHPSAPREVPGRPRLDVGRFWAGAGATVLVCALLGFTASVIFDEVFDIGLLSPPDLVAAGDDASWAGAGALFALLGAAVLHLLVVVAPRPRMFFGWLVGLTAVILAVLPFTGDPDPLPAVMTAIVWVVLGIAVSSMLSSVLGRTLAVPVTPR